MELQEHTPEFIPGARIKVAGIGGGGINTLNRMAQENIEGVEYIGVNTDAQVLSNSLADKKVNIGLNVTRGLGAGATPEVGRKAAEENIDDIKKLLEDTDMLFVTAGMGGGTGTGSTPVIAQAAKEMGILTVGVVTKPFSFEGKKRTENAIEGLEKLKQAVDTLIVIPNDKIFNIIDKKTTFKQAFSMVDRILMLGVQGISDLIVRPGDINIDFADIKVIMQGSGSALLGIGYGDGENRAVDAARRAIENPLLDSTLEGAENIIFAVTGGEDLTPVEVQEAARVIEEIADPNANIIWGMTLDDSFEGEVKFTIIATGFPEQTQENIIKGSSNVGAGVGKTRNKGEDFVSRTLKSGKSYGASFEESSSSEGNEEDYDTPAFLRKKINK